MKVIALTLTTLFLAVNAHFDYTLQCTRQEMGIRWPSYYSNSEYYVCQREGGKQLKNQCPPGELFTFVLQACTAPHRFIPPPPLEVLPTSAPHTFLPIIEVEQKPMFPKPAHPSDHLRPTEVNSEHVNHIPQHKPPTINEVDVPEKEIEEEVITGPPSKPAKPTLPLKPKPQPPNKKQEQAPLPPTPPPTPPVVKPTVPSKQQTDKKKPPVPPTKKDKTEKNSPQPPQKTKQPPQPPTKSRD